MRDANVGTLFGQEIHLFEDLPNLFTAETSEKTKYLHIDKAGFNLYFKEFLKQKYDKCVHFIQGLTFLKETKTNKSNFYRLLMMINHKFIMANTIIV